MEFVPFRNTAEAPNEKHQFPTVDGCLLVGIAQCWHTRKSDAIFDDVVNFPVRKPLGRGSAEIGCLRIKIHTHLSLGTAVDTMTYRTAIQEVITSLLNCIRICFEGVFRLLSSLGIDRLRTLRATAASVGEGVSFARNPL